MRVYSVFGFIAFLLFNFGNAYAQKREKIKLNAGWSFMKYMGSPDNLIYDLRPIVLDANDSKVADSRPTDALKIDAKDGVLKSWILPTANDFIKDPSKKYIRPNSDPGSDFDFVKNKFDDSKWENVDLPHDWAIKEPFFKGDQPEVGGGMGRLPSHGVAWYRKKLNITAADVNKNIYLDIDGAMSYAIVWCNGHLVGGWPYGYNSFRLDLTKFLNYGGENQIAIRLDNPNHSARWYPGGGIYRNVWLTKTSKLHVAQWGTFVTTPEVSALSAKINIHLKIKNNFTVNKAFTTQTEIYFLNENGKISGSAQAKISSNQETILSDQEKEVSIETILKKPKLWNPYPQKPNLYVAKTSILIGGKVIDTYDTIFGVREITFKAGDGIYVNNKKIKIKGVNQHHDLGAIGAAFNTRAAERQLEMLREMGCNAIRMSHNPPAPELLDLCDKMGFLVIDEIFDSWEKKKTPHDFHLIFPDWHEADLRAFIRRDRNHPSILAWSFGNEVGEQYTDKEGAALAAKLRNIVHEEDPTRPASASQNYAKPDMPFTAEMDFLNLNYQGEGIRDAPEYKHLKGIRTTPLYEAFQKAFPNKVVLSTESASTLSTRGTYLFPVTTGISAPISDGLGGDPVTAKVSAYELYTAQFGASPDKVFMSQDKNPFVAGEMVWTGWDYIGEPTPYYTARSSYSGIIDLAGFKKDRFYLYQSRWRPDLPLVHILPHWNWPNRTGEITPVHVFTSGNEAELFLNNVSQGKKKKGDFEYRLRWDEVKYQPGTLKVVAYKDGKVWATESIKTTKKPYKLKLEADRKIIKADGEDLSFITAKVLDQEGNFVPDANLNIDFLVSGKGSLIATDNGDPADLVSFGSKQRKSYNGLALGIIKSQKNKPGKIKIKISAENLESAEIEIISK